MSRTPPVVAVTADFQMVGDQPRYTADAIPVDIVARALKALPLVIPPLGAELRIPALLDRVDGLLVSGGLSNVCPALYGRTPTDEDGPFDPARDRTALPLIRTAVERGVPMLLTCRGLHELNVAFGGSLKREDSDQPEEVKHGTPASAKTDDERYRIRHDLNVRAGGLLASILGQLRVRVNSLHSQLIDDLGPGLVVEATAHDGTIEAVSVAGAPAYVLGVMFHPEYWAESDPTSRAIMQSFGDAVRAYARRSPCRSY